MKRRIFASIFLTSFLIMAVSVTAVLVTLYNQFTNERKEEVRTEVCYIKTAYTGDSDYLHNIGKDSKNRITLISADGSVIYDSFTTGKLENHLDRPEIKDAVENGTGESVRASETLGEKTYYYAVRLGDGSVLRVAATMKSIYKVIDNTANIIALIILFTIILALVVAHFMTRYIVAPINRLDLEMPLQNNVYDELSPLLVRMDKQNKRITDQMRELSAKQNEFAEITGSMSESVVVFGNDRKILSANNSASELFTAYDPVGLSYLGLCRDHSYIEAVEAAFCGKRAQTKFEKFGRIYRISVNPVTEDDGFAAVLFAVDITETEMAEKIRREFSANVSHELKTPLTTIMGCAELIKNGLVEDKDYTKFASKIYSEAGRLLSLIEDIIKLSRLDEQSLKNEFRPVDLYEISGSVVTELENKAKEAGIKLTLEGESAVVNGIENTLHEMIYNLCDNAINYNRRNGYVRIDIRQERSSIILTVEDNGIGIAPEYHSRVFERFYRVDKSHSKETGGTGLGLSIVKHGAMLHGADIKLESTLGSGTKISLVFCA